ncbi:MAG: ROK family protein [Planctomycetota bacterium]
MTNLSIGVDIGGSHISAALVNPKGKIITKKVISFLKPPDGKKGLLIIEQLIKEVIYNRPTKLNSIIGIGISCPGSVDVRNGVVLADSPNLIGWKGTKIKQALETTFKIPVLIDNDANLAAWGEKYWGAGKNNRNFICLTLGTGVGGGIIINDKIYHGSHFYAGEIGHMKIKSDPPDRKSPPDRVSCRAGSRAGGPLCSCGSRGCLEALVGAPAIVREFIKPKTISTVSFQITAKTVFDAARRGNKIARKVVYQTACYLGYAIASLVNIFDPEIIVIGGGIAQAGKIIFQPISNIVKTNVMMHPFRVLRIVPAKLGENAGILGAAALVFDTIRQRRIPA